MLKNIFVPVPVFSPGESFSGSSRLLLMMRLIQNKKKKLYRNVCRRLLIYANVDDSDTGVSARMYGVRVHGCVCLSVGRSVCVSV